jgi:hypothetical protein
MAEEVQWIKESGTIPMTPTAWVSPNNEVDACRVHERSSKLGKKMGGGHCQVDVCALIPNWGHIGGVSQLAGSEPPQIALALLDPGF